MDRLAPETISLITCQLPLKDLRNFSQTNRRLRSLVLPSVWESIKLTLLDRGSSQGLRRRLEFLAAHAHLGGSVKKLSINVCTRFDSEIPHFFGFYNDYPTFTVESEWDQIISDIILLLSKLLGQLTSLFRFEWEDDLDEYLSTEVIEATSALAAALFRSKAREVGLGGVLGNPAALRDLDDALRVSHIQNVFLSTVGNVDYACVGMMRMMAMLSKAPNLSKMWVQIRESGHKCRFDHGVVPHPFSPDLVGDLWGTIRELDIDCQCACCWKFFLDSARSHGREISTEGRKGIEATGLHTLRVWSMPPPTSWPDFLPTMITSLSATAVTTLRLRIDIPRTVCDTIALLAESIPSLAKLKLSQHPPAPNGQSTSIAHLAAGFTEFHQLRTLELEGLFGGIEAYHDRPEPESEDAFRQELEALKKWVYQQLDETGQASIAAACTPLQEIRNENMGACRCRCEYFCVLDVVRGSEEVGPFGGELGLRLRERSW